MSLSRNYEQLEGAYHLVQKESQTQIAMLQGKGQEGERADTASICIVKKVSDRALLISFLQENYMP